MQTPLLSFPLPILVFALSSVACLMAARLDLGRKLARNLFVAFFGFIAIGTLFVGLRFGYGVERFVIVQRCLPLFGGPLLYLAFAVLTVPMATAKRMVLWHLGAALTISLAVTLVVRDWDSLDIAIGVSYLFYAIALVRLWRKGANHLSYTRLEMAPSLHKWVLWGAGFLLVSLAIDTAIALSFAFEREDSAMTLISSGSLLLLGALLVLILSVASQSKPVAEAAGTAPEDEATHIEAAARMMLTENELYLDTELSLERLAKRLHVPARALSGAINQTSKMNVSQYVNSFRLDHAAMLLRETSGSVSQIMERSGFLTRSNFYREFQRVYGCSPAQYREQSGSRATDG